MGARLTAAVGHRITVPLRPNDFDAMGHVNQAVFHAVLEHGRSVLFAQLTGSAATDYVLARAELDHVREAPVGTPYLELALRIESIGHSSFTTAHEVLLPGGDVSARGRAVLVAWDGHRRASRPLSDVERDGLRGAT